MKKIGAGGKLISHLSNNEIF